MRGFVPGEQGWAYSKPVPKKGKHLIWLKLSTSVCCVTVGLVPAEHNNDSMNRMRDFNINPHMMQAKFLTDRNGDNNPKEHNSTFEGKGEKRMGMYVDMNARVVTFFR